MSFVLSQSLAQVLGAYYEYPYYRNCLHCLCKHPRLLAASNTNNLDYILIANTVLSDNVLPRLGIVCVYLRFR